MTMRTIYFLLLLFILAKLHSQVVFAPKGAEWNYRFIMGWGQSAYYYTEKIAYLRDSVAGSDTVRLLKSGRVFRECDQRSILTLIKQKGDTLYFKNVSTQQWEILYNMAALPGEKWKTTLLLTNNTLKQYTVTVLSAGNVTVNGFNLKKQHVKYVYNSNNLVDSNECDITERFGCSMFMYNYLNQYEGFCDGDVFQKFVCYKDSAFPQIQFTQYPCNYTSGIEELVSNSKITLSPNPASDFINLELGAPGEFTKLKILNSMGELVKEKTLSLNKEVIPVSDLPPGIYSISLIKPGSLTEKKKLVITR
jgi:hypothetical protein